MATANMPDVDPTVLWKTRIVIVKNGMRFDNLSNAASGIGLVIIDAVLWGNYNVVYGVVVNSRQAERICHAAP